MAGSFYFHEGYDIIEIQSKVRSKSRPCFLIMKKKRMDVIDTKIKSCD